MKLELNGLSNLPHDQFDCCRFEQKVNELLPSAHATAGIRCVLLRLTLFTNLSNFVADQLSSSSNRAASDLSCHSKRMH